MYKLLISLIFISTIGCSEDSGFTEKYTDSPCVPPNYLLEALESRPDTNSCCSSSGIAACCFGGSYVCVNGDTGVGCGCPTN